MQVDKTMQSAADNLGDFTDFLADVFKKFPLKGNLVTDRPSDH
jgi:hypothetical protein